MANLQPVGTGPYQVVGFESGTVIYEPNASYWGGRPAFKRVELVGGIAPYAAAREVMQAGTADFADNLQVEADSLSDLETGASGHITTLFGSQVERIMLNFSDPFARTEDGERSSPQIPHPYFSDLRVRQAINLAIDRDTIAKELYGTAGKPTAQLLAGEMPIEIEAVFTANGLSLYPFNLSELHSKCSCPDPKNPCKHIAAVYYQLGDFFREDPFVLFQLRGRSRASILEALRQRRQCAASLPETIPLEPSTSPEPIPVIPTSGLDLRQFWAYTNPLDPDLVVITPSDSTVLDVLGKMPLPPEDAGVVMSYLREIYQVSAQQAMAQALS